jgi:hypothetical protein
MQDQFSAAVAQFISFPIRNTSQYVTYDPLRCAISALEIIPRKSRIASDDDSISEQEESVTFFDAVFIIVIVINLGLVASSHVKQADSVKTLQVNTDIVMNVLYTCELLTRLVAYNSLFLYVFNNPFDFCVVLVSDIFLIVDLTSSISLPGVNIFRVARLLRAVKALYRIPRIHLLLKRMFSAVQVAILPCVMLLFWIFCFALIGIQLFKNNGIVSSRLGFESFDVGYITSFSVMTFEKWLDVLDGLISQNQILAVIYFIIFVGVGKYLGLYGITASVLMSFSLDDVSKHKVQKNQFEQKCKDQEKNRKTLEDRKTKHRKSSVVRTSSGTTGHATTLTRLREDILQHDNAAASGQLTVHDKRKRNSVGHSVDKGDSAGSLGDIELGSLTARSPVVDLSSSNSVIGLPFVGKADTSLQSSFCNSKHDVLFCFTPENSLRGLAVSIISSSAFSAVILVSILASIVLLLSPTPYKENDITPSINRTADYVFQGIFVLECLLKVVSTGFLGHLGYWKNSWNRLDFFIIVVGALDLLVSALASDVQVLRVVRVLRMIRPLRLLNRFETLQVIWFIVFELTPSKHTFYL